MKSKCCTRKKYTFCYILSFVVLWIYFLYWLYRTEKELKELGANTSSFI
ncbi:MAG: DUF4234 domain-containing protein [Candidatus Nanopusillus sp.]